MLHTRTAPAEQQDLLAALDVFLPLPLCLAKQDRRINRAGLELPRAQRGAGIHPTASPGSHLGPPPSRRPRACLELFASPPPHPPQPSPIILESQRHGGRASRALPFPYSASCQKAQALLKDVILFLQVIKPFALQAASSLQLSHAWPRAIPGLKKTGVCWMEIKGSF